MNFDSRDAKTSFLGARTLAERDNAVTQILSSGSDGVKLEERLPPSAGSDLAVTSRHVT